MRACHSFGRGVVVGWEGEPHHPLHPAQPTHRSPAPLSLLLPPFPAVWLFATTWCHVLGLTPPRMHKLQDALPPLPPSKKTSEVAWLFYALLGLGEGFRRWVGWDSRTCQHFPMRNAVHRPISQRISVRIAASQHTTILHGFRLPCKLNAMHIDRPSPRRLRNNCRGQVRDLMP